jgi:hypothetical protein
MGKEAPNKSIHSTANSRPFFCSSISARRLMQVDIPASRAYRKG